MSVTITSAPAAARPRAIAAPLPRAGAGDQRQAAEQRVLHGRRLLQRLADYRLVADVIDQQQDQPRIEGTALLVVEVLMGVDDRIVDVVGLRQVQRTPQRAGSRIRHAVLLNGPSPGQAPT